MEHVGSAHDEQELAALKAAAAQRLALLYPQLDLALDGADGSAAGGVSDATAGAEPAPLPIVSSRAAALWDGLAAAYDLLGFDQASDGDEVFRHLVLARIIEPTSKQDSLRVLTETGIDPVPSHATPRHATPRSSVACRSGPPRSSAATSPRPARGTQDWGRVAGLVRRLHPLLRDRRRRRVPRAGLLQGTPPRAADHHRLVDRRGRVPADGRGVRGQHRETTTMLPTITAFMAAHQLSDVTVVADAGMISAGNKRGIEAAGLSFILGTRIPEVPYVVAAGRREHEGEPIPDGLTLTHPWPAGPP